MYIRNKNDPFVCYERNYNRNNIRNSNDNRNNKVKFNIKLCYKKFLISCPSRPR